jgi:hypothetical protein
VRFYHLKSIVKPPGKYSDEQRRTRWLEIAHLPFWYKSVQYILL